MNSAGATVVSMGGEPRVSVIIPAFNAAAFIGATLESVLAQSYGNVELIVVDDGSTDDTGRIVARYGPSVSCIRQPPSGGAAVPRNTGIARSTGDYLCFLDADDLYTPDRLRMQIGLMQRHPQVGLSFCDYRNFSSNGPYPSTHFQNCPLLQRRLSGKTEAILDHVGAHLAEENFGITGTFLIRRAMLAVEPGFDASLRACEDFHYYFRVARHGSVGIIDEVGLLRRLHDANMSGDNLTMMTEGVRSRTMLRDSEPDAEVRTLLTRTIAGFHASLGRHHAFNGQFTSAWRCQWQALRADTHWSQIHSSAKAAIRTALMALRLYPRRR